MLVEESYVRSSEKPEECPQPRGRTIVGQAVGGSEFEILQHVKGVWRIVASWGRWCDDACGQWPSPECCQRDLPTWYRTSIADARGFDFESWLDDLHDREWIWWSAYAERGLLKVDIQVFAAPTSIWTIEDVLLRAGIRILYDGDWLGLSAARDVCNWDD